LQAYDSARGAQPFSVSAVEPKLDVENARE
jgi:hypothetical protein